MADKCIRAIHPGKKHLILRKYQPQMMDHRCDCKSSCPKLVAIPGFLVAGYLGAGTHFKNWMCDRPKHVFQMGMGQNPGT